MATQALLWCSPPGLEGFGTAQDQNPHQPFKVTWKLRNGETYEVLKHMTATHLMPSMVARLILPPKRIDGDFLGMRLSAESGFLCVSGHKETDKELWRHAESSL